jgi:hypothetical protein
MRFVPVNGEEAMGILHGVHQVSSGILFTILHPRDSGQSHWHKINPTNNGMTNPGRLMCMLFLLDTL